MGQKNKGTHTGIGTGELSEAVFAFALIGKTLNVDMWDVLTQYNDNEAIFDTVSFYGDGKTDEAVSELNAWRSGFYNDTTFEVINATVRFVNDYDFPSFDTVYNMGASGKDDIALYRNGERVQGFSLKWKHDNAYRQQSVAWKSIDALYGMFVDMDGAYASWDSVIPTFTTPALRYSTAKGDYSDELRTQTDKMMSDYERIIWGEFIARMCEADPKRVATALLTLYTGGNDDITFVELSTGKATDVSMDSVDDIASTIGRIGFERNDSTGRTRRLIVTNDGAEMMTFVFTQSTNRASIHMDRDYRIAKPQVYVEVSI